ncbi:MAG: hypothetical protein NT121_03330 [Chloroflexi bacterium]|nr:hypothetical protein [Chloroflexota bacterium]
MINRLLELAIQIQQIPAPTHEETLRGQFIFQKLQAEGLPDIPIQTDQTGNVLTCLRGNGQGKPLIISAHMDTVFPSDTVLTVRK